MMFFWIFVIDCLVLGYIGGKPAEGAFIVIGQVATTYYFAHLLVIIPIISRTEKVMPLPSSINKPVLQPAE